MKIVKKLKDIHFKLKNHPVTEKDQIRGIIDYIIFNIKVRLIKQLTYNWIEGLKFFVSKGDAGLVGNIYFGLFEFEESIFLLHLIEKEDIFLDVGANLGHYSLLMSGLKNCKSIAIEPVPVTYNQLKKQIELNHLDKLIDAQNIGLSNENGKLFFSTHRGTMNRIVSENYKDAVKVRVSTLDEVVKNSIPIAIKIDVEGYEKYVMDGGTEILSNQNVKAIILELNQSGEKYGFYDKEIYNQILEYGFKPYAYNFKNRELTELQSYNKHQFNTLFVRDRNFVFNRLKNSRKINIRGKLY